MLFLASCGLAAAWVVLRNNQFGWLLLDVLGSFLLVSVLIGIQLPNLKSCTIFLSLLFIYDVFFVFITPFFTKDGQSVMIQVATGGYDPTVSLLIHRLLDWFVDWSSVRLIDWWIDWSIDWLIDWFDYFSAWFGWWSARSDPRGVQSSPHSERRTVWKSVWRQQLLITWIWWRHGAGISYLISPRIRIGYQNSTSLFRVSLFRYEKFCFEF